MSNSKTIKSALISVFHKDGLAPIVKKLNDLNITIYSTGGTEKFIKKLAFFINLLIILYYFVYYEFKI